MKETLQKLLDAADIRVNGDRPWDIRVHDERLWRRAFLYGNNGLGDGYVDGWWDCRAIDEMLCRLLRVVRKRNRRPWRVVLPGYVHSLLVNLQSLRRAFQVGEHHYDIGNALYRAMLGEQMVYSCAYWQAGAGDLDQAQEDKLELVCRKLRLERGQRVLDIGCGWGGLALALARMADVEVLGVTLSVEQHKYACEWARAAGLEDRVRFELRDYRLLEEEFERVVSVGMFEHVGVGHYGEFFGKVRALLKEDGVALLHSIGRHDGPGVTNPWIRRYIFPGGYSPALSEVLPVIERERLWATDIELEAVLDQVVLSLNDVLNWKPGTRLLLNASPKSTIDMRCGDVPLFVGGMGQRNGNIAVKINQKLRKM